MFTTIVLFCAATATGEVDMSNCIEFEDTWGPYETKKECVERGQTMVSSVLGDVILFSMVLENLEFPESLASRTTCELPGVDA